MASLSRTVHLRTPESVIQAYENWNVPHFAIVNGKQLIFAYDTDTGDITEGSQLLNEWVNVLFNSGSAGIYTLCIYKELKSKAIASNTPYNGSVNFQFHEYRYPAQPGGIVPGDPALKLVMDQLQAMQLQITRLQEEKEQEDDEGDSTDKIIGGISSLLNNPIVAGLIGSLLPKQPGGQARIAQPAAMESVHQEPGKVSRIAGINAVQENDQLLAESLAKLKAAVPDLPLIMAKLVKLQEKKPLQFKMYMTALMAMKL